MPNKVQIKLKQVAEILRSAERIGSEKDQPEGTRYIQISDTLASMMLAAVERELSRPDSLDEALNSGDGVYRP